MQHLMKFTKHLYHGRAAMITDVILDSMGVLLGILLVILIMKIWSYFYEQKNLQKNDKLLAN